MKITDASLFNFLCKHKDKSSLSDDESEDIGDVLIDSEVNSYLNNKKEVHYKKIIWEQINKNYLQEQAIKKAGAASVVKKSTKRQRKREAPTHNPVQDDSEATREILTKKRLCSKINFDVLEELFSDVPASGSNKKQEASNCKENTSSEQSLSRNQLKEDPLDSNVVFEEDVDAEHEDPTVTYGNEYYDFENEEEYGYGYDDYGGDDEC